MMFWDNQKSGFLHSCKAIVCTASLGLALGLFGAAPALADNTLAMQAEQPAAIQTVLSDQLTLEDIDALSKGTATVYFHDGRVTFVDGSCTTNPVLSMDDAAGVVASMTTLLGGDTRTQFEPWRTLQDSSGNVYYVFRQMYAHTTVSGGAVKVITDAQGTMIGLVGSIESELPDVEDIEGISAGEAEQIVLDHATNEGAYHLSILDATEKIILPVNLEIDVNSTEEKEESHFVWVVYTNNPQSSNKQNSGLPYLAHYVTMDGAYLYNMPTVLPGDEAGSSGFASSYTFEFMEPAVYQGPVTLTDGSEHEITVPVMRDTRTGMYYLGDIERRIVVADCYEFLYNDTNLVLVSSPDNTGWEQNALISLYNYGRIWDYYHEFGWTGGDGENTPILILNNYCDEHGEPVDNAAYAGKYLGWQIFLSSSSNTLSESLDVIAHEYTHCVTGSVTTYNSYKNDYGAINEAISDIQGNLCEMMYDEKNGKAYDEYWALGEDSSMTVRSMSNPHKYAQPEYTWDVYYKANVMKPFDLNDRGGVHTNSSLLNMVAYKLCVEGGMSYEEARLYWFAVDCSMVPGTDYPQLAELLPWVLDNLGMNQYQEVLEQAIDSTKLGDKDIPESFDEKHALVELQLPDSEIFSDGNWVMGFMSINFEGLKAKTHEILHACLHGDLSMLPPNWSELIFGSADEQEDSLDLGAYMELYAWFNEQFGEVIYADMTSSGQDGRTIRMVSRPGDTMPVLFHVAMNDDSTFDYEHIYFMLYINNRWYDFSALIVPYIEIIEEASTAEDEEAIEDALMNLELDASVLLDLTFDLIDVFFESDGMGDFYNNLVYSIEGAQINNVPLANLEEIVAA